MHSSVSGHFGCSTFFAIMNNTAMNISVQVFLWIYVAISFA